MNKCALFSVRIWNDRDGSSRSDIICEKSILDGIFISMINFKKIYSFMSFNEHWYFFRIKKKYELYI